MAADIDPMFRRLAWGAVIWCVGTAAVSWLFTRDWSLAFGVIGGGALVAVSLLAIRSSVDMLVALMTGSSQALPAHDHGSAPGRSSGAADVSRARGAAVRLTGRYALLALMLYVMIARLRLHPIGLLIGASSLVVSATFEAVRVLTRMRTS
jgi:hypothetical protein